MLLLEITNYKPVSYPINVFIKAECATVIILYIGHEKDEHPHVVGNVQL